LRSTPEVEVAGLFTTVNEQFDRVAMHAVRRDLLAAQARAAGLALYVIPIPNLCPNAVYEERMRAFIGEARGRGIEAMAFGDLFLEDIRRYRERNLDGTGIRPLFPIWQRDTCALAAEMIAGGLRARVACLDPRRLPAAFAGREFDAAFLADLPESVDPCGENGEFHTFAYAGPMFGSPVPVRCEGTVERDGFVFTDLVPALDRVGPSPNEGERLLTPGPEAGP
jgi:uncharacterized protein (TIGR00290 family)